MDQGKYISPAQEHICPKDIRLVFQSSSATGHLAEFFQTIPFKIYWIPDPNQPERRIYSLSENFTGDVFIAEYNNICDLGVMKTAISRLSDSALPSPTIWPRRVMSHLLVYRQPIKMLKNKFPLISHICQRCNPFFLFFPQNMIMCYSSYTPLAWWRYFLELYIKSFGNTCDYHISTPGARSYILNDDSDFMHAYTCIHGLVFRILDGTMWRLFPRFDTYSADYYPRKVSEIYFKTRTYLIYFRRMTMTCLNFDVSRTMPWPRCLLFRSKLPRLGSYRQI